MCSLARHVAGSIKATEYIGEGLTLTNPLPNLRRLKVPPGSASHSLHAVRSDAYGNFLPSPLFMSMLCLERKRAERAGRRLVLLLLELRSLLKHGNHLWVEDRIYSALTRATRDTDIKGWHQDGVAAVIFTEIPLTQQTIIEILAAKVRLALEDVLGPEQARLVGLSFHSFPDHPSDRRDDFADPDNDDSGASVEDNFSTIYPDLADEIASRRVRLFLKRCLDIVGGLLAILILAPMMLVIAAAIKLTSPGPVLFRQTRLGQGGKGFMFLKFRSMHSKADHSIHEEYVKRFIANQEAAGTNGNQPVFKLQADPRITRVGRFLRRTSLDEVPQFFNVLTGDMSLVGPRPPLPYEFASYEVWHRRRLLAMKPGITGAWQVEGRSRVKFDDMVRMDIAYARNWTLRRDIEILLRTPSAILSGNGAC